LLNQKGYGGTNSNYFRSGGFGQPGEPYANEFMESVGRL